MSEKIKNLIKKKPELFDYADLPTDKYADEQRAANDRSRPEWANKLIL